MATVGELKRQGSSGLHIRCSGCGWITILWWRLMPVSDRMKVEDVIGRLKCQRCNCRPDPLDVRPFRQGEESDGLYT